MPHIVRYAVEGKILPSVNTLTGSLSKEGLIRNYYRKHGFKWCDKDSGKARDRGAALATALETLRKEEKLPTKKIFRRAANEWTKWFVDSGLTLDPQYIEPHLVNPAVGYHGSPDGVLLGTEPVLFDDKMKKRFSDYALLMNEHAYAACTHLEINSSLVQVPWKTPIETFWFFTYNPKTGKMHPHMHKFDESVWQDFLKCKDMHEVNKRAEKYFSTFATLLPDEQEVINVQPQAAA